MTAVELMDRTHALLVADESVYAARQSGLYRIGADGQASNLFAGTWPGEELPALALARDARHGRLLIGAHGGIARSDDGNSWDMVAFRSPPPLVTCLTPLDARGGAECILAGTFQDGIFRSGDAGQSWRASSHGLFDHSVNCLAASPSFADDGVVYAGTGSGIYRSENGGKLWHDLRMPADDETVLSLAISAEGAIYAGTEAHGLLRSHDNGQSWACLIMPEGELNAVVLAADSLIIQMDDRALRSHDDGDSWSEMASGIDCLTVDTHGGQLILARSDGGLRRIAL